MPISSSHHDLFHNSNILDKINLFQMLLETQGLTSMEALALLNTIHMELAQSQDHSPANYTQYAQMMEEFKQRMPALQEEVTRKWSELQFILKSRQSTSAELINEFDVDPNTLRKKSSGKKLSEGNQPTISKTILKHKASSQAAKGSEIEQDEEDGSAETEEEEVLEAEEEETDIEKEQKESEDEVLEEKEEETDESEVEEEKAEEGEEKEVEETDLGENETEEKELEPEDKEVEEKEEIEKGQEEGEVKEEKEVNGKESETTEIEERSTHDMEQKEFVEETDHMAAEAAEAAEEATRLEIEVEPAEEQEPPMEASG
jgi:hypothetical protein